MGGHNNQCVPRSALSNHDAHITLECGVEVRLNDSSDRVAVNARKLGHGCFGQIVIKAENQVTTAVIGQGGDMSSKLSLRYVIRNV
jgi:hypothetical protein